MAPELFTHSLRIISKTILTNELLDGLANSLAHGTSHSSDVMQTSSPEIPKGIIWTACRKISSEGFKPFLQEGVPSQIPSQTSHK